jgi:hypothetical protein
VGATAKARAIARAKSGKHLRTGGKRVPRARGNVTRLDATPSSCEHAPCTNVHSFSSRC